MDLPTLIETTLLQTVSATTENVYNYILALTESFQNEMLITYELSNTNNINTFDFKNAVREYELTVRVSSPTVQQIIYITVFIINALLGLRGGNVGYIGLVNEEQPTYDVQKQLYSNSIAFNVQWIK